MFFHGWAAFAWICGSSDLNASAKQTEADAEIRSELSAPFCYFSHPTDQLGFMGSPKATVVTYDGAFIGPYGELSFYAGRPGLLRPICQRVKTLVDGYIPIIQFGFDRDGLRYDFEAFATPVDLDPKKNLVTFIRCTVKNPGRTTQGGILGANFGDVASKINDDPSFPGFNAQRKGLKDALGAQRTTLWHTDQFMDRFAWTEGGADSSGPGTTFHAKHLVLLWKDRTAKPQMSSFSGPGKEAGLEYDFSLRPGQKRIFEFEAPSVPIAVKRVAEIKETKALSYDAYRRKTVDFWRQKVARADRFLVPDRKVVDTFRTSLVNDLVAREINPPDQEYQRVNKIHYDYMWIRDSSFFVRSYDMVGLSDIAAKTLAPFLVWKDGQPVEFFKPGAPQPEGARLSVQDDYWGQSLWAVGAHYRITQDRNFLKQVYPLLGPHIETFVAKCKADPVGLWPVAGPYDNEAIDGHYTGHSFWALLGLRYAVLMAKAMGRTDDAANWQAIHDGYERNFLNRLHALTAKSEGYMPPGMDDVNAGNDWDNASGGIYPFEVLSTTDPIAQATLRIVRDYNYREGIITYGGNAWVAKKRKLAGEPLNDGTLHHYETFYVTEGNLALGEQRKAIEDLYSILAHTGSTNSGFEFMIPAWGSRDPGDNFTPHGWFASRYMALVRDVLVREQGDDLHLASALAPGWVQPGKQVTVTKAPTFFGTVSYRLKSSASGAVLTLDNHWRGGGPEHLIFHLPWFVTVDRAAVDGKVIAVDNGALLLPNKSKEVRLRWRWTSHPDLSYEEAIRLYLDKLYHPEHRGDGSFLFPRS